MTPALRALVALCLPAFAFAQTAPTVTADRSEQTVVLSPFTVTVDKDTGYAASNTLSGTRLNTPIRDIPRAITIITRDFLDDTAAFNIAEAVRYTSGMVPHSSENAVFNENVYTMRGFRVNVMMRDGALRVIGPANTQGIERVEVVKGPASILYGQTFPGGIINYITKKPLFRDHAAVGVAAGSWNSLRGSLDVGGVAGARNQLSWRFNASHESAEGWRDFEEFDINYLAPSFSWRITPRTTLNAWADITNRKGEPAYVPIRRSDNRGFAPLPRTANVNGPDSFRDQLRKETSVELLHTFSSWLSARLFYNNISDEIRENRAAVEQANADNTYAVRGTWDDILRTFQFGQANLAAQFETGPVANSVFLGVDLNKNWGEERVRLDTPTLRTINLADYGAIKDTLSLGRQPVLGSTWVRGGVTLNDYTSINRVTAGNERRTSYVALWQAKAWDGKVNALLGARRERGHRNDYNVRRLDVLTTPPPFVRTEYRDADTFQAGATWRFLPQATAFASYSESFLPNTFVNPDGERFDPQTGEGFDVGVKVDLFDGRLSGTVAWYDVDFTNILRNDPTRPNFRVASGQENSTGVEADLVASFTRNWTGTASFSTSKTEIVSDISRPNSQGKTPPNIPDQTFSAWNKYAFGKGGLDGVELGLGVIYMGERTGILDLNTGQQLLVLGDYTRLDLMASYRFKVFGKDARFSVNVRNATDVEYENNEQNYGTPREIVARFDLRF